MAGDRDITLDPTGGGIFLFLSLACGVLARVVLSATGLPYTVILLLLGALFGALDGTFDVPLGSLSDSIHTWANLDPHMILYIFLPGLIFGSAFAFDFHIFKKEMWQMMLLAGPGVVLSSMLTAIFAKYVFPYEWGWFTALTFGSMMSATDPVAVVALLRELGASKRLSLLIEGESLLNDGTAMVVFVVFMDAIKAANLQASHALLTFTELTIGGPILGIIIGMITLWVLKRIHFDSTSDITITLVACYGVFIIAEGMLPFQVSGILAVVSLGLMLSSSGRAVVADHHHVHEFWEIIEYFANTIIFILAGVVIVEQGFTERINAWDWVYLLLLYVAIHIIRGFAVLLLSPMLAHLGYGMTWKEMVVLTYSGLRGAVGLALALLLRIDPKISEKYPDMGNLFVFHMAGIAALTLLVNASTTGLLVEKLGVASASSASKQIFHNAYHHIKDKYEEKINEMKKDDFYSDADWEHVTKWMDKLSDGIGAEQARHDPSHVVRGLQSMFRHASQAMNLNRSHEPVQPLDSLEEHDDESEDEEKVVVVESANGSRFAACAAGDDSSTPSDGGSSRSMKSGGSSLKSTISRVMSRTELRQYGVGSGRPRNTLRLGSNGLDVVAEGDEEEEDTHNASPSSRAQIQAGNVFTRDLLRARSSGTHSADDSKTAQPYDEEIDDFLGSVNLDSRASIQTHNSDDGHHMRNHMVDRAVSRAEVSFVQLLAEARHRYLNLVKSKIWEEFGTGYLTKTGVSMLMNAASFSQDTPDEPLAEWQFLSEDLQLNQCTQALLRRKGCTGLGMRLLFTPLMNQFDVATSFIRVHKQVQEPFQDLIVGHTHSASARRIALAVAQVIFAESEAMVQDARQVVSSIETYIPKTVRAIKTEQVIHALLKDAKRTAHELLHHGELEEKEYTIIDEALSHLHKKVRVPKQLQIPSLQERLRTHGLLRGMSDAEIAKVESAKLPKWYPKGQFIFKQGEVATGVYIVFGGTVSVIRRHAGADTFTEAAVTPMVAQDGYRHERGPMIRGAYKSLATMVVDRTASGEEVKEEVLESKLPRGSVVGLLSMLTGQPMLTSVRCDSLVDGVWFDEWTIGKLLKSKQEHRDDPVKVPSVLQQNLCQMAARHICQLYIPRLRRLGAQRLAAMLDSAVLVRPVQGAGLIIKGHAVLLTGALVEPAGSSHMPSKPARAVPSSEFMASNVGASADTIASVVSTRSVDGSADRPPSTRFVNKQVAVSFLPMSDEYRYFCQSTRLLVFPPGMTREIGMSASNAVGVVQRASKWFARSRKSGFVRSQFDVLRSRSKLMASARGMSPQPNPSRRAVDLMTRPPPMAVALSASAALDEDDLAAAQVPTPTRQPRKSGSSQGSNGSRPSRHSSGSVGGGGTASAILAAKPPGDSKLDHSGSMHLTDMSHHDLHDAPQDTAASGRSALSRHNLEGATSPSPSPLLTRDAASPPQGKVVLSPLAQTATPLLSSDSAGES